MKRTELKTRLGDHARLLRKLRTKATAQLRLAVADGHMSEHEANLAWLTMTEVIELLDRMEAAGLHPAETNPSQRELVG